MYGKLEYHEAEADRYESEVEALFDALDKETQDIVRRRRESGHLTDKINREAYRLNAGQQNLAENALSQKNAYGRVGGVEGQRGLFSGWWR